MAEHGQEFTQVFQPRAQEQRLDGLRQEEVRPRFAAWVRQDRVCEVHQVDQALGQARHANRMAAKPRDQIAANFASAHLVVHGVRGDRNPENRVGILAGGQMRRHSALFQHAQELGLRSGVEIVQAVEQQ